MSQVEDRLRSALATAPTPATTIGDPIADLERRVGHAQVRLGGLVLVVVAALVAAIVVPLSLIGRSETDQPLNTPLIPFPATSNVTSVTAGGDAVWSVVHAVTTTCDCYRLQRRDPVTGKVINSVRVGTPEEWIAYGAGRVWTFGGGDGGYPHGKVNTYFAPPGQRPVLKSNVILGVGHRGGGLEVGTPHALAFTGDRAYGVLEGDQVAPFLRDQVTTALVGGPTIPGVWQVFIVGSQLVAAGRDGVLRQYDWSGGMTPLQPPLPTTVRGVPVGYAPGGLWCWLDGQLVREDIAGHQLGKPIPVAGRPYSALSAPDGGLYVAGGGTNRRPYADKKLDYYSPSAVAAGATRPTERKQVHVDDLALDPAGGVIVGHRLVGGGEDVYRWNPGQSAGS